MYDVIIIGAGVIGGMIARELSKYKVSTALLEKENDVARGATGANSGIVHAGFDAKEGSLKAKMNVLGCSLMEDIAKTLGVHYRKNGSIVVAFDEEQDATVKALYERGVKNGVPELRILTGDEAREIEPKLSKNITSALLAPTAGIICPYSLAIASIGCAMDNGASLFTNCEVCGIEKTKDGYKVTAKDGRAFESRFVVNCAGLYSDKIADLAGKGGFKVHPRSGEYMLCDKDAGELVNLTVFKVPTKMGKGILVSPTADGNLILGPTSTDIEDKEDRRTTEEGLDQIVRGVNESVDDVPLRAVITSFTGLRSVGSTGDFIINESEGFVNCGGVESPGLTSSPAIAIYVRNLLIGAGMEPDLKEDWNPGRKVFKAEPKKYGRIICRCETISEGEIISAIHTNPPAKDIDGVKKRTRSGMGRCQGGFCQPFVAEIIARELSLDLLQVTKSGKGSELLTGRTKEV